MHSLSFYNPTNLARISWNLRISDIVEHFAKSLSNKINRSIIADLDKATHFFEQQIESVNKLTAASAAEINSDVQKLLPSIEKMDELIEDSNDHELLNSFKAFEKTVYSYEAKLHRIMTENNPVVVTPDYIKNSLAALSKKAVK